jgi:hypothetical protein
LHWGLVVVVMIQECGRVEGGDVTYDGRSLIIDGQRKILFSGSIHYPRSTPEVNDTHIFIQLHLLLLLLLFFFFFKLANPIKKKKQKRNVKFA